MLLQKLWLIPCLISVIVFFGFVADLWKTRNLAKNNYAGGNNFFNNLIRTAIGKYIGALFAGVCAFGFFLMSF